MAIVGAKPKFVQLNVTPTTDGPVLYALSADGEVWEKWPGTSWAPLSVDLWALQGVEFDRAPVKPWTPPPATPVREWTAEELIAHFTPKALASDESDVNGCPTVTARRRLPPSREDAKRCPRCTLLLSSDGTCLDCPGGDGLTNAAQGRREV